MTVILTEENPIPGLKRMCWIYQYYLDCKSITHGLPCRFSQALYLYSFDSFRALLALFVNNTLVINFFSHCMFLSRKKLLFHFNIFFLKKNVIFFEEWYLLASGFLSTILLQTAFRWEIFWCYIYYTSLSILLEYKT